MFEVSDKLARFWMADEVTARQIEFFLFPALHTEVLTIDTSSLNDIAAAIVAFIPYGFIAGIFLGMVWLWRKRE